MHLDSSMNSHALTEMILLQLCGKISKQVTKFSSYLFEFYSLNFSVCRDSSRLFIFFLCAFIFSPYKCLPPTF